MKPGQTATIAIIGAGAKGTGIAEVLTRAGKPVLLFDVDPAAAATAVRRVIVAIRREIEAGGLKPDRLDLARQTLRVAHTPAELGEANVVIECVAENLDLKRKVLGGIEDWISTGTALVTNTGWLSVNAVGAHLRSRDRFAGFHFLTPASTPLVEIIPALTTSPGTIEALQVLAKGIGHTPIISADLPGFVVAHLNRGLMGEAARLIESDVASPPAIDAILKSSLGLAHGPFELYDMLGLDVVARAARHIWEGWGGEPRFRDVPLLATRVAAGLTGLDGHDGFYPSSAHGRPVSVPSERSALWEGPVFIAQRYPDLAATARSMLGHASFVTQPSAKTLNIVTPLGGDTLGEIVAERLDPTRTVGLDVVLPGNIVPVAHTTMTTLDIRRGAASLIETTGRKAVAIQDTPGLIVPRIAAMIAAVGYAMLDKGVASAIDIEAAATKALGYGLGPFALSRKLGPQRLVDILTSLLTITGDARWRVPTNLRHVALLADLSESAKAP